MPSPESNSSQARARQVRVHIKEILVLLTARETNASSCLRRFADAVRDDRCFLAQIRTDDKNGVVIFNVGDIATEPWESTESFVLIREIAALNAMIDV